MGKFYPTTPTKDGRKCSGPKNPFINPSVSFLQTTPPKKSSGKAIFLSPLMKKTLYDINGGLTVFTSCSPLFNKKRKQTSTPSKRSVIEAPIRIFLGKKDNRENILHEKDMTAYIFQKIYGNQYKGKKPIRVIHKSNPGVLNKLPLLTKPQKIVETTVDKKTLQNYRGCRKFDKTTVYKVMNNTHAQDYVHAVKPELTQKTSFEWLHLLAYKLGGTYTKGPQVKGNLVGGTRECNRLMLSYENEIANAINRNIFNQLKIKVTAPLLLHPTKTNCYVHVASEIQYVIETFAHYFLKITFYPLEHEGYPQDLLTSNQNFAAKILKYFSDKIKSRGIATPPILYTPNLSPNPV